MLISKLDAAKRQLDVAIKLFLLDGDPVAVHALAAASHQLLLDVGKLRGIQSFLKGQALDFIREEKREEYLKMVDEARNFFKHADRDPGDQLDFKPDTTVTYLLDAVSMYQQIAREIPGLMGAFRMWFMVSNPDLVKEESDRLVLKDFARRYDPRKKASFLAFAVELDTLVHGK